MKTQNKLFKGFVIVLAVALVLMGGLLVLKNLNLGGASAAGGAVEPGSYEAGAVMADAVEAGSEAAQ